ncbi:MAG: hypothetical protein ACKOZY_03220 [Flavobacteriales bacterium]
MMGAVELLIGFFYLITLLMKYSGLAGGDELLRYTSYALVAMYVVFAIGFNRRNFFFIQFFKDDDSDKGILLLRLIGGLACSYAILTSLFHEAWWPSRDLHSVIAMACVTITMFFAMAAYEKRNPRITRAWLFRCIPISVLLMFYTLTPIETRVSWLYEDLYMQELRVFAIKHPEDEEAWRAAENYERKLKGLPSLEMEELQGVDETQAEPSE